MRLQRAILVLLLGSEAVCPTGLVWCAETVASPPAPLPDAQRLSVEGVSVSCLLVAPSGAASGMSKLDPASTAANGIDVPDGGMLLNIVRPDQDARVFVWGADGKPIDIAASYSQSELRNDVVAKTEYGAVLQLPSEVTALEIAVISGAPPAQDHARVCAFATRAIARDLGTRQRDDLVAVLATLAPAEGAPFLAWLSDTAASGEADTRVHAAAAAYALTQGAHPEALDALASDDQTALAMARRAGSLAPPPPKAKSWILQALTRADLDEDALTQLMQGLRRVSAEDAERIGMDWISQGPLARAAVAAEALAAGTPAHGVAEAVSARLAADDGTVAPASASADQDGDRDGVLGRLLAVQERTAPGNCAATAAEWLLHPLSWRRYEQAVSTLQRLGRLDAPMRAALATRLMRASAEPGSDLTDAKGLFESLGGWDAALRQRVARVWIAGAALPLVAAAADAIAAAAAPDADAAAALAGALGRIDASSSAEPGAEEPAVACLDDLAVLDPSAVRAIALAWIKDGRSALALGAAKRLGAIAADKGDAEAAPPLAARLGALGADDAHYGELLASLRALDRGAYRTAVISLLGADDHGRQEQAATSWADSGDHDDAVADAVAAAMPAGALDDHLKAMLAQLSRIDAPRAEKLKADRGW
jgi:hypothetical protein